jgi:uncharacterized protein involved in exopolysaccharide biosynthesis
MTKLVDDRSQSWTPQAHTPDVMPSPYALGATLLRERWMIARWTVVVAILAVLPIAFKRISYTSNASFIPEGGQDISSSGLGTIAARFGIQMGGSSNQSQSPQFYIQLLGSRAILAPIVNDTFTIAEEGRTATLLDILEVKGETPAKRTEKGVQELSSHVGKSISDRTGVITISTTTRWPSLSHAVTDRLLTRLNDFNLNTRQRQARAERRFTEQRLADARANLAAAEERLQEFATRNRTFESSPDLSLRRDRLRREVDLQQSVVSSLATSYEEVRMREVRDIPVITVIEEPSLPTQPNPRGRIKRGLLGLFVGGLVGVVAVLLADAMRRSRTQADPDAMAFFAAIGEFRDSFRRPKRGSAAR